ncbi:cytochrome oxidase c subunit VIb-domain-containing protein [Irpex rosettiformis]|uniref:Cytochrome oxidase c subunit VIb-domain-containing protein n=1 Tax=Irpex rosettiformis TaxID=378272 RepID=A0ACB8U760_9APHY|nr:cytochrome oxidase c subunit VIb-domain-containing protein [Irpex rosettiformis]
MGWFSSSKTESPDPVSRQDRQKCWDSRDAYFACLDGAGVVKAGDEGPTACKASKTQYEKNCAKSWVRYLFVSPSASLKKGIVSFDAWSNCSVRWNILTSEGCSPNSKRVFSSRAGTNRSRRRRDGSSLIVVLFFSSFFTSPPFNPPLPSYRRLEP